VTGVELRRLRRRLGLTQAQLATLVGVHANSIARQERDEMGIRESQARLIKLLAASAPRPARRSQRRR